MIEGVGLFLAGLIGGMVNAIAGGGSFITFPALMAAGVSPIAANATNTLASITPLPPPSKLAPLDTAVPACSGKPRAAARVSQWCSTPRRSFGESQATGPS